MTTSTAPVGAGSVTPESDGADRKAYLNLRASRRRLWGHCTTCAAWRPVFDDLADRNVAATERAVQARLIGLAMDQQQAATGRHPVGDMPRSLRVDLDALADAVAVRLRRPA